MRCTFCPWNASGNWAVTAQGVDGDWRREIVPICARCNRLIGAAGREGRMLKATGERWYAGHTMGPIAAKWTPGMHPRTD